MDYKRVLRQIAVRDDRYIASILANDGDCAGLDEIDGKTRALVSIGSLIALDAAPPSYMSSVEAALDAGATVDEIVSTLVAVMPVAGVARVVSAAPNLGLALGYDVTAALEEGDDERATML